MFRGDAVFHNILTGSQAKKRDSSQPPSPNSTGNIIERNVCTNPDKDKERDCMMRRATEFAQSANLSKPSPLVPTGPTSPRGSDIIKDRKHVSRKTGTCF